MADLPDAEFEHLAQGIRHIRLNVGDVLYDAGDRVDRVYFPESCLVTLLTPMQTGRDVASTIRGREGAIGYLEAVSSGVILSRATIQIAGEALYVSASRFREVYEESPSLRDLSRRRIQILLADARQSVACQATHAAPARLARMMLECFDQTGSESLRLTHDLIGDLTGLGRTTISQTAAEFRNCGIIEHSRGEIVLKDMNRLREAACECYGALRHARSIVLSGAIAAVSMANVLEAPF